MQRVVLGKFASGGYGLRVSQPGYNANAVPVDNEHLIFNSDWSSMFPVHTLLTATVTNADNIKSLPYPTLGYVPFMLVTELNPGKNTTDSPGTYLPAFSDFKVNVSATNYVYHGIDANNVYIQTTPFGTKTYSIIVFKKMAYP